MFDPRRLIVDDLQWRFQDDWKFEARLHDILSAPLPRQVDSIFCIEFLQYISRDEEDYFVRNLRDSLLRDFDFLLIGSPSYGANTIPAAQETPDAEAPHVLAAQLSGQGLPCQSKFARGDAGVYRRTGAELKALMERFFHNIFIFSMVDDLAQPGIQSDAQHVFALSCGKKA